MIRRIRFGEPTTSPGLVTNNDGMAPSQSLPEIQSTPGLIMEKQTPTFYPCYRAVNLRPARGGQNAKSERIRLSHHPDSPCNKEVKGAFGPGEMRLWLGDEPRKPNQYAKKRQHEGHQTHG